MRDSSPGGVQDGGPTRFSRIQVGGEANALSAGQGEKLPEGAGLARAKTPDENQAGGQPGKLRGQLACSERVSEIEGEKRTGGSISR